MPFLPEVTTVQPQLQGSLAILIVLPSPDSLHLTILAFPLATLLFKTEMYFGLDVGNVFPEKWIAGFSSKKLRNMIFFLL